MVFTREQLLARLKELQIEFSQYEHPVVLTVEAQAKYVGDKGGALSKNLFLKDKKSRFYIVSALADTKVDLKVLALRLGLGKGGMRMAPEEALGEILQEGETLIGRQRWTIPEFPSITQMLTAAVWPVRLRRFGWRISCAIVILRWSSVLGSISSPARTKGKMESLRDRIMKKKTQIEIMLEKTSEVRRKQAELKDDISSAMKRKFELEQDYGRESNLVKKLAKRLRGLEQQVEDIQEQYAKHTQANPPVGKDQPPDLASLVPSGSIVLPDPPEKEVPLQGSKEIPVSAEKKSTISAGHVQEHSLHTRFLCWY